MITQLEIAIQSTYDTNMGSGPIASALNWECATRLNKVGVFSFEMPLADSKRSLLVAKRYVRCYGIVNDAWTEQGKPGIIERIAKSIDGEGVPTGMIRIEGTDLLGELNDILIHELDIIDTDTRIPDIVQYYDGTADDYIVMTLAYNNNPADGVDIPADDEDWLYIGDADPFDIVIFDLGAKLNDDSGNFTVQYSTGVEDVFSSGTILSDTTKVDVSDSELNCSFGQDGAIRWERQKDWATQTNEGIDDKYWLRFRYSEDMSGDVSINEITITQEIPTATALADWLGYTAADGVTTPISTLAWSFDAGFHEATDNKVFLKLREVSAFKALAMIAEQTGENFRLGDGREIQWLRADKTASDIVATNAIDATAGADATMNCWITSLRQSSDAYELVGRVYPRGGGRGATRISLSECTRDVPGANYAGYVLSTAYNYLEKTSVETDYGRPIERPKYWPELMSPNAANAKDENVANALFDLTYQYLQRHCIPQTAYDVEVVKLDGPVPVGTTLQVAYWQTVDGSAIMDVGVDGTAVHLWVLESTQRVDNKGLRSVAMKIATTDAWPTSAGAKMQEVVYQVLAIQATDGPMSAASLTVGSAAALLGSLDLSAYYKKPTDTRVILGLDAGNVPPGNYNAVIIGKEAGYALTSGADNTYLGYRAGRATTTGYDNTMVGSDAMRLGLGTANTGVGYRVLENVGKTTDGLYNTAMGHEAGRAMDEGDENVAMGADALSLGDPSSCVAIGYAALEDAGTTSDGDGNTGVGATALQEMDEGHYNTAVGYNAMGANTEGDYNTALGDQAMYEGAGSYNIAIGRAPLHATTAVNGYNIAIGDNAGYNITSGIGNIAIGGAETMMYSTTGNYNIIIGHEAGVGAAPNTFANNVIIGYQGGYALRTGGNNVLIGHQAGLALTGTANVFIGYLAGSQAVGVSNQLYIENSNSATPLIYGEFDNDLVKIHGDLCLGTEDGLGRLNFTEGTAIADGIVWGLDANKVTLYRSADDMLKTDDSLTVLLGLNVGTPDIAAGTGQVAISSYGKAYRASADNIGVGWDVYKRGSAGGATAAVVNNAELGYNSFYGWDGAAYGRGGYIIFQATQTWDETSHGTDCGIFTTADDAVGNTVRLTIGQDGLVTVKRSLVVDVGLNVGTTGAGTGEIFTSGNILVSQTTYSTITQRAISNTAGVRGMFVGQKAKVGPAAVQNGDYMVSLIGQGWDTSGYDSSSEINALATETWSDTAHGSKIEFYTVDNTTVTQDLRMTIEENGVVTFTECIADGTCEIFTEDALVIIKDIHAHGSGQCDEYGHEHFDMEWVFGKYPFLIHKADYGYFDKLGAKSDLLYRATMQLDGYRLTADAEREAIRARLLTLETS